MEAARVALLSGAMQSGVRELPRLAHLAKGQRV